MSPTLCLRLLYATSALATIALGMAWRSHLLPLTPFLAKYGGDALWALMVFFIVRAVRPRSSLAWSAVVALGISFAVEFSQLYTAPWIEAVRRTRLGHLVLGSTFNPPDLLAYTVGVALGCALVSIVRAATACFPPAR